MAVAEYLPSYFPALLVVLFFAFCLNKVLGGSAKDRRLNGAAAANPEPLLLPLRKLDNGTKGSLMKGAKPSSNVEEKRNILFYKEYYHKIHNLEKYPEILAPARDLLVSFFAETIDEAQNAQLPGILAVDHYSPEGLKNFLQAEHDSITQEWEEYVSRREGGAPPEMFSDKEECLWWLRQVCPAKYVDGAWLGHINKVTTPFHLRKATKDAWQIMSEELGDGLPVMNHVYVYRKLMQEINAELPDADSVDFIDPRHELNEECSWKSGVAQLLISLFPQEFLPEILGFNMHFEALTMETMKASKEVEEMGFDAYYFILHISIDNADSGHTAVAMEAVVKYLELIRQTEGDIAVQQAWKRVQAGFILSKHLTVAPESPSKRKPITELFPRNAREAEVVNIFCAKAPVAHKVHCTNRVKLGGRTLVDWLDPEALSSKEWQQEFMDTLSNFKPWIRKGEPEKSKLMHELSWEGKMFGSFTKSEVEAVRRWIKGLGAPDPQIYWSFVQRSSTLSSEQLLANQDIRIDYPVIMGNPKAKVPTATELRIITSPQSHLPIYSSAATAAGMSSPEVSKLLPLWFTSQCLLESYVNVPSKTTSEMAASIVRVLRAQYGFEFEGFCVSGMDEARREDTAGIIELGVELMEKLGLGRPANLKEVLEQYPSAFAEQMLHLSMRPMECLGILLGLSWAFVGLHELMSNSPLLTANRQSIMTDMVRREREFLEKCVVELRKINGEALMVDFHRAYYWGKKEIEACFAGESQLETPGLQPSSLSHEVIVSA